MGVSQHITLVTLGHLKDAGRAVGIGLLNPEDFASPVIQRTADFAVFEFAVHICPGNTAHTFLHHLVHNRLIDIVIGHAAAAADCMNGHFVAGAVTVQQCLPGSGIHSCFLANKVSVFVISFLVLNELVIVNGGCLIAAQALFCPCNRSGAVRSNLQRIGNLAAVPGTVLQSFVAVGIGYRSVIVFNFFSSAVYFI